MQITFETNDKEELKNALNNAIILYADLAGKVYLVGPSDEYIGQKFAKMLTDRFGDDIDAAYTFLKNRLQLLKELYDQL